MRRGQDDGFTLIEMMIAMIILAIIMAPLVTSFTLGLATAAQSEQDLTNTTDVQAFTAFFTDDVGSSDTVKTGSPSCGGAGTVVQLTWDDGAKNHAVAYVATEDSVAEADLNRSPVYRIDRIVCINGNPGSTIPVARSVTAIPVAKCDGTACPANSTPQQVAVKVTEYGNKIADPNFAFTLNATRRVTTP